MSESQKTLLIVEDDPGLQMQMRWGFDEFEVDIAGNRIEALSKMRELAPPVVLLDLGLPPDADGASEGLATLEEILRSAPETKVIMVTGNDEHAHAVRAIGMGAYDFYQKPVDLEVLRLIVARAYRLFELERENRKLLRQPGNSPLNGIIAASPQMLKVCRTVEKVATSNVNVLLLGDSGTGKELVARALHDLSPRSDKRFIAINCAAIPETLLESELFGYEKGAFTGAAKQTRGKVEYADGGTLFLDEIGDLPLSLQVKLLRFLQERVIERLGGRQEIPVDVRVICATHQNVHNLLEREEFREDLYYRVSEITIQIPPLCEREGDAILLARTFLDLYAKQVGRRILGFTPEALAAIDAYEWPGNVRELENKIKRAVIMTEGNRITGEELELKSSVEQPPHLNLKEIRDDAERKAVTRALGMFSGNVSKAAEVLGISRPTLYSMMVKYDLKSP